MAKDWQETSKKETSANKNPESPLSSKGIGTMQGNETTASTDHKETSPQILPESLEKPAIDKSKLEYKTGSPHADYQLSKDIEAANKRHELGQQAIQADSLPDAVATTATAHKEANQSDTPPMDEYMRLKHGTAPYTETYPKPTDTGDTNHSSTKSGLTSEGKQGMQGGKDTSQPSDINFTDKKERPISVRTFPSGDSTYIRAYDNNVQSPPDTVSVGQAGHTNLHLEKEHGGLTRARLQDIYVNPEYRQSGIGNKMLNQAETTAKLGNASEIYGTLDYKADEEAATRDFYKKMGYQTRFKPNQSEEVYKLLN